MLKEKIAEDVKVAMKAGDPKRVSVLRLLLSALRNVEIELRTTGKEVTDEVVLTVLGKQVKQRRESIAAYEAGGRADLVEKEKEELAILLTYMPVPMSEDEVRKIVKDAVAQSGSREMGVLMKAIMPLVKGKADGSLVRRLVEEEMQK
ncbi:MAG: GatB/YqeY domain-containing protein [Patescibacteria group bacterium]